MRVDLGTQTSGLPNVLSNLVASAPTPRRDAQPAALTVVDVTRRHATLSRDPRLRTREAFDTPTPPARLKRIFLYVFGVSDSPGRVPISIR